MSKCSREGGKALLLLLVTIGSCYALNVPSYGKNPSDALSSNSNKTEGKLQSWHGLDYEYGAFDHSEWEEEHKDKVKNSSKTHPVKNSTSSAPKHIWDWGYSGEEDYWDDYSSDEDADYSYMDSVITLAADHKSTSAKPQSSSEKPKHKETEAAAAAAPSKNSDKVSADEALGKPKTARPPQKKDEKEQDYDWSETVGDSDDGEGAKANLGNLPTDNDQDSEKYFDPQRYKDRITLHAIEDLLLQQWTVNYPDTNLPCIMLKGRIKLIVPLNPGWFNKDFVEIDVPYDAKASGTCNTPNHQYQEIILNWNVTVPEGRSYVNQVVFGFATNTTSEFTELNIPADKYALVAVTAVYYKGELGVKTGDKGIISYSANDLAEFITRMNQSMSCYKDKQILLGSMQLTLSNVQLEAFRPNLETLPVGTFSRSVLCSLDEVVVFDAVMTFIIWFWIGALLVVLAIFVVLLALGYRRRQHQEGGFGYKVLTA